MKILLITSVYKNEVVGPARFARLLEESPQIDVDILTSNVIESNSLKSVNVKYKWWQKKLKIYFSVPHFFKRINELKNEYDIILYNSSVLVDSKCLNSHFVLMVNDEKLASLKFSFNFDYLRRLLHRRAEKNAVRHAHKVIVNSNYLKGKISTAYSINPNKIAVLYKGISLDNKQLKFNDYISSEKPINILFVKNDFKLGGLLDLISALGMLEEKSFNLTIIGTSNKVNDYLESHQNINYNILGFQSNDEVVKAMYNHDILCIPARFEPLGVAVMEGLAVGIPTITTGVGGLPEVTGNGAYVWECEPNNPVSISKQIEACLTQSELRLEKSKKGRHHVHAFFDFKKVVTRLKEILHA